MNDDQRTGPQPAEPAAEEYPLFCLDNGDAMDERRYRGPFSTKVAAEEARARCPDESFQLRRCRALRLSECLGVVRLRKHMEELEESFDEELHEDAADGPSTCWADWENDLVRPQKDNAWDFWAFRAWLDKAFETRIYICEPSEKDQP